MMIGIDDRCRSVRHLQPGNLRQHHVEEHDVGVRRVELLEGLGTVARHPNDEPLAGQPDGESVDERVLVVDDEDKRVARLRLVSEDIASAVRLSAKTIKG